ncbi:MAG TPA: NAD-dependent epimerase/dehydratase family protein [Polyangia bacterium]|nr:NAD-dependent epimerase/dehydratase family protein [Polyangia bacterium]
MKRERVAVLGAGGFIGSHLVPALLAAREDLEIVAVDLTFEKLVSTEPRVRFVTASVDRPGLLDDVTARCSTVLSLTALCNPSLYNTRPLDVIDANYTDLVPLVKLCAARGVRLVHFSTCEVYGRRALDAGGHETPTMNEETTGMFLGPVDRERWTYACAKQLLERVIWAHGLHGALDFTIVRPFNVIGPRMDFVPGVDGEGVPRVLASFMSALLRDEELPLVAGGARRRSFISVDDFVEAVVRIVERPAACRRQILNLGNPANEVSVRALAEVLARAYSARVPRAARARFRDVTAEELYGAGYDDSEQRVPDIGKARRLLSWQPETTLEQMLPGIVDDYVARYGPALATERRAVAVRATRSKAP